MEENSAAGRGAESAAEKCKYICVTRNTGDHSEPICPLTTTFPKPGVNPDGQNDELIQSVRVVPGSQFTLERHRVCSECLSEVPLY